MKSFKDAYPLPPIEESFAALNERYSQLVFILYFDYIHCDLCQTRNNNSRSDIAFLIVFDQIFDRPAVDSSKAWFYLPVPPGHTRMIKLPMREKFLERVYKEKCTFQLDHEEVNDVENKTLQILRDILDNVGRANPAFKIWEIIKSGSFYEGTKVGPPDEFDFMIVFENLSRKESIELETGCTPWFQKIKVVDADVKTIYNKYLTHKKEYLGETSKMVYDFWKQLLSVLKEKPFSIETRKGKITAIPNHKQKLLLKYVGSCMLSPSDNSHGLVPKDSIEIGIDLMPAIKHPNVSTVMSYSGFPKQFKCDLQETGCHIISKSCHKDHFPDPPCWFITLAAIELKTMQNMDEKHKKAYKVLKSLVIGEINYPGKCINLSSYMLKTALMFHVHGDVQCSGTHFGDCIENILSYLGSNF
ncbi:unnamed protein product [Mytilus coruscus]|uniref:Uncharacterized protein n=1 Tax=Mytilus coruscus TaxID=42192 RepID=A0A6J8CFY6_MYTCO|nr:unnamed protein product [Mytilus coruscus]